MKHETKLIVRENPVEFDFYQLEEGWMFEGAPFTEDIDDKNPHLVSTYY